VRRRRLPFTLRLTAAAVTAGIIAAVVWVAGFDRIVSRFQDRVTPPPVTAVPVDRDATPPSDVPSSAWATRDQTPARPESRAVNDDSTVERRAPAIAIPLPAPVIVRRPPVAPSVVGSRLRPVVESRAPAASRAPIEPPAQADRPARMERSDKDVGDGSAAIDWLLKDRR
jgi:hypothetical protein